MSGGQQNLNGFFPVDDCFGTSIGRPLAELVEENGVDWDSDEELVSFEEFVRGGDKQRKKENEKGVDLHPISDGEGRQNDVDGFFDIALNGTVPEDPLSSADRMPRGKGGRSELYKVQQHISVDDYKDDKWNHLDSRQKEWGALFTDAPTTTLRHSLCPTVGEGGGWLSGGRTRRESQDSAAYGYEPPDEPCPVAKAANTDDHSVVLSRGLPSRRSLKAAEKQTDDGPNAAEGTHSRSQMVQSNSLGDFVLTKFLCCFRALNPTQMGGGTGRKCGDGGRGEKMEGGNEKEKQQKDKCYSWDKRDELPPNLADLRFANESNKTLVKEPGQLNGQPFQVEHCRDSLILLMDRTASLTVDDSRNCVLLVGPCQGSIFLRDCTNILILAVCQQFRTRDCRQLVAHLFCATSPTIEETDVTIGPLELNYSGLLTQMHAAGLSPFFNQWDKVHNFTPETGKCQLTRHSVVFPTAALNNFSLVERLNNFVAHSPLVSRWELCVGNSNNSQLFVEEKSDGTNETKEKKDSVLILLSPIDGTKPGLRFYAESVQLAHGLLELESVRLVAMHDIDLMMGEWDALLGQNKQQKKQRKHNATIGKVVTLEIKGSEILKKATAFLHSSKTSSVSAQLVDGERMEQYTKQLYRFCEIRQNI